jgi:hypothetical protein
MHYFAALSMNRIKNIYSFCNKMAAVGMVLALLWLTVSAPFILAAQQELADYHLSADGSIPSGACEDENSSPFGNATEEKAPSSSTFSEEYLHDHHTDEHSFSIALQYNKHGDAGTYIAFHGELLVPPPNAA